MKIFAKKNGSTNVKEDSSLSKEQNEAIAKLYESLVPGDDVRTVDVKMIVEEAFPLFKETLDENAYAKLMKYLGFGVARPQKNVLGSGEYSNIVAKLRTIKNAQFYICGFRELISKYASKLDGAPEGMSDLVKAKIMRMYAYVFAGGHFLVEDYKAVQFAGISDMVLDLANIDKVNKKPCNPEILFDQYDKYISLFSSKSISYDELVFELTLLGKRTKDEVLKFAELKYTVEGGFVDVNEVYKTNLNLGNVRSLKTDVHPYAVFLPIEYFLSRDFYKKLMFGDVYLTWKTLNSKDLSDFPKVKVTADVVQGSRAVKKELEVYEFLNKGGASAKVSGYIEVARYNFLFEHIINNEFEMQLGLYEEDTMEIVHNNKCNTKLFGAAYKFACYKGYITDETLPEADLGVIIALLDHDPDEVMVKLKNELITLEEADDLYGIDVEFEEDVLKIEHVVDPMEVVIQYAKDKGYVEEATDEVLELISEVFVRDNEEVIHSFSKGEISSKEFEAQIGYDDEFADMYFNLTSVDVDKVEEKLQELKKSCLTKKNVMAHNALLVKLYCYIIENHIPCGPKGKTPKGNKNLKPKNLRAALAA